MNFRKDLFYLFLLLGLGVIFWSEALVPGKLFFLRDIPAEILAKKHFWSGSSGLTLWFPYSFFGVPYAANPQSEAFYLPNFIFLLFGPERGVVYDVVLHHLFFLLTFYLALRRVGFGEEASLIGAAGFGFGGYLISLASIPLFFRTIAWLGLLIICLNQALETKWLRWSLLLGLVMAVQIMGGEIQLAGMSWVLAFGVVVFAPQRRIKLQDLLKASGSLALGLAGCVIMNLPQIALAKELIPLSNRAAGISLADATTWSLAPSQLGSLLIPNYLLPESADPNGALGYFYGISYFLSHYLGVTLLLLVVFSFAGLEKLRVIFWLILFYFGLMMILEDNLGVYPFLHKYLPGFHLFKFPDKFFLFLNFSFVLLAVCGYDYLSGRKLFVPWLASACLLAAAVIIVFLFIHPLRIGEFGNNYQAITAYLFRRNILRISMFFLIGLGLILLIGRVKLSWLGLGLALVIFLDLFDAHHRLNPVTTKDFFQPNEPVRELLMKEKNRIVPPRIISVALPNLDLIKQIATNKVGLFAELSKKSLNVGWSVYFGLNDIAWAGGTFYPSEVGKYLGLLIKNEGPENEMILARSGVEYHYPDRGFEKIHDTFPRAMIYYQARAYSSQDQIIERWSNPDFPAGQVLLIETGTEKAGPGSSSLESETARIVEYRNEKVTVEAEAKEAGWLLLLDTYYPGWKAEVDGNPVEIFRADGFFRAVKIPVGKHTVVFNYSPAFFNKSVWFACIGLLAWLGLIALTFAGGKKQEKAMQKSREL
ncbi:MAG: YfhO family protein [bacterium]|nr:YfhO family protein [bacterium]